VQAAEAIRLIRQGGTPSEIGARLRSLVEQTHTYMVPADLFHIYKRASKKGDKSIGWGSYTLGSMLDVKPILHCHMDNTGPVDKVRGFETGVERLFGKAADRIRRGLEAPYICISYGGSLDAVPKLPGYAALHLAARENGVEILLSPMSKTAAVNVGPGAVSLAFAASGQPLH
jgi:fatty acid-binding protein DegV